MLKNVCIERSMKKNSQTIYTNTTTQPKCNLFKIHIYYSLRQLAIKFIFIMFFRVW